MQFSGGVSSQAGLALARALFDGVMNINIELLMAQQDRPTLCVIMPFCVCMRFADPVQVKLCNLCTT